MRTAPKPGSAARPVQYALSSECRLGILAAALEQADADRVFERSDASADHRRPGVEHRCGFAEAAVFEHQQRIVERGEVDHRSAPMPRGYAKRTAPPSEASTIAYAVRSASALGLWVLADAGQRPLWAEAV